MASVAILGHSVAEHWVWDWVSQWQGSCWFAVVIIRGIRDAGKAQIKVAKAEA